ncbi:hypothetical protein D9M70_643500 [compost metagenome]
MGTDLQDLADFAALQDLLHLLYRRREAPAIADLEQIPGAFHGLHDTAGVR